MLPRRPQMRDANKWKRQSKIIDSQYLFIREWKETYRSIEEQPLAHRYRRVAGYEILEKSKINTETNLRQETQYITQSVVGA